MDLTLVQLQVVVAVAEHGSFTRAGAVVNLSQASVSRSVAAVERILGVRLFDRTTRRLSVTGAGAKVVAHARRALDEVAAIGRVAAAVGTELRVGYAWSALGRHTVELQRRWEREQPSTVLTFVHTNTPTAGLDEGHADVAVLRRPPSGPGLRARVVGTEQRYAALPRTSRLARRRELRLADLAGQVVAVDALTGTTTPDLWEPGAAPRSVRNVSGVDEWLTAIATGQAVGVTSEATAQQNPRPGVLYRPVRDAAAIPVLVAWRAEYRPAHLDAFVRLVAELYGHRG